MSQEVFWDISKNGTNSTVSNNNLTAHVININNTVVANIGQTEGKKYFEISVVSGASFMIGVAKKDSTLPQQTHTSSLIRYYHNNGRKYPEASSYASAYDTGDVVSVLIDMDSGVLEFWKNGVSQGVSHNNLLTLGEIVPAVSTGSSSVGGVFVANFGATPFEYNVPEGYTQYGGTPPSDKILLLSESGKAEKIESLGKGHVDMQASNSNISFSNDNKTASITGNSQTLLGSKLNKKGKWYWEIEVLGSNLAIGILNGDSNVHTHSNTNSRMYRFDGQKTTPLEAYGSSYANGSVISVLTDMDSGTIEFWLNGVSQGVAFTNLKELDSIRPAVTRVSSSGFTTVKLRLEEVEMEFTLPSGYKAFGDAIEVVTQLSSQSEQDFIDHGMSPQELSELDFSFQFTEKRYIQNQSTPLGEGKVFEQPLDEDKIIKSVKII